MTDDDYADVLRNAKIVDEMRALTSRYALPGVYADVLWDVTEEKPNGDPPHAGI